MSENRRIERILVYVFCPSSNSLYSELASAFGRREMPARASSMVQHTFRCCQTKPEIDMLFAVCRVLKKCGRSICICRDQLGNVSPYFTIVYFTFSSPLWSLNPSRDFWNFIWGSLMRPNWPKLASLAHKSWHQLLLVFMTVFSALIGHSF